MTNSIVFLRHYFFMAVAVSLLLFLVMAPSAGAASPTLQEQHQLAAISVKINSLKAVINSLYASLFKGSMAQTYSSCSSSLVALLGDGCHYMYNDSSGNSIYCDGPMTKSAKSGDTTATSGCSSSSYSSGSYSSGSYSSGYSCDANLINLLGTGCHYMYNDSVGNAIYCDGPMTKSAKTGDTATTSGCSSSSSTGTTTTQPPSGQKEQIWNSLGLRSWIRLDADSTRIEQLKQSCVSVPSGSNVWMAASGDSSSVDFGMPDPAKCQQASSCSSGQYWTGSACATTTTTTTTTTTSTSSCPSGYTYTPSSSGATAYCQSNTSSATCQPLGGGTVYTCPAPAANTPPVISNINATPSSNSVIISWTTDKSSNSKVEYWISSPTGVYASDQNFILNHVITIYGLQASTTYTYNVISEDANYYRGTASNKTFTTLPSSTTTTTGSGACTSSLIALLGSDCHYMYNDSVGNAVYCDGPMTKSAKSGDTVTTSGCSSGGYTTNSSCPSGYYYMSQSTGGTGYCVSNTDSTVCQPAGGGTYYTCPTTTTTGYTCDATLTNLLGTGCHYMYNDSIGNAIYCDGPMTKSAKKGDTTATSGCSSTSNLYINATTTSPLAPATPTNFTAQASGKDIKLSWTDVASETEYKIYRKSPVHGWAFLVTIAANQISHTDLGLSGGTYEYLIQACSSYGCSRDSSPATATISDTVVPVGKAPVLTLLSPNTGSIGTVVIVSGSNILAKSNQINFEGGVIRDLSSSDGKTVTFTVPDDRVPLCTVTEPRCSLPAPYNPVKPGTYNVSLTNDNGTSNSLTFTVKEKTTSCPSGYHYMAPSISASTGYCMADTDTTVCQPLGGGAKYTCLSSTGAGDTTPPSLDYSQVSPRSADNNVPVTTKIHVVFNEDVDPSSFGISQFFSLVEAGQYVSYTAYTPYTPPATSLPGKFTILPNGFDFVPDSPLKAGASYTWYIFPGVKDKAGNKTYTSYQETFRTAFDATLGTGSISGKVFDGKENIVPDASINLSNFSYSYWRSVNSGKDGAYKFSDIPAGSYRLSLYNPSYKTSLISPPDVTVNVSKGVDTKKDLSFVASTKTIKGTIKTSAGVAITDARINAYRQDGPGWAETESDATGAFSLTVSGGTWRLSAWPKDYSKASWTADRTSASVTFLADSSVETKTIAITALSQNSKIIGKLLKPGGVVPASYEASVNVSASDRSYSGSQLSSDGSFSIAVTAGTYEVFIWSQDQTIKVAPIKVTVLDGETKDLGTIRLTRPSEKISGKVSDQDGNPVAGANVSAYQNRGGGYTTAKTDASGAYTLFVNAGIWTVSIYSDPNSTQYVNIDPPEEVEVKSGGAVAKNLRVSLLDAAIAGVVKDSAGNVIDDFYGYVYIGGSTKYGSIGGPINRGTFNFKVPSGGHSVALDVPPGSGFTSVGAEKVTVSKGETAKVTLTLRKNTSGVNGFVVNSKGNPIVGVPMRVFASGEKGSWQESPVDSATGRFQLKVSSGTWYLGASSYEGGFSGKYFQQGRDIKVEVPEGKIVTQNITFTTSDATIKGVVKKSDGSPMSNIWVSVDSRSHGAFAEAILSSAFSREFSFSTGAQTDKLGNFTINVPAGTYFIHVYSSQTGLINPEEQKVTIEAGGTADVSLSFRSPDAVIKGVVYLGTVPAESFVGAWSEKGGYVDTKADASGKYSLKVNKDDVWRVYASRDYKGDWYKSTEAAVKITTETEFIQDLILVKEKRIPPPVTTSISADKPAVVSADDGAKVAVPANSVATSGGATVTINPDTDIPKQGNTSVVGVGYNINAFDDKGKSVTSLNTAITITIPYDPKELEKKGIKPEELKVAFFDETAGVWKELKASIVNEKENTVSAVVDHLTRFAVVAASDNTPPESPASLIATPLGEGKIKLSWENPAKDFSHAKIYRSDKEGAIGEIRAAEIFAEEFTDEGLTDSLTYYYIARAVDPAGNESGNKEQVNVKAKGTSAAKKLTLLVGKKTAASVFQKTEVKIVLPIGSLTRNLSQGAKGDDVKILQDFLAKSGVYPEGIVNGFFGGLTKQAVIRFQEKYASEVLIPVGLAKGSGFVGSGTRKKINELLEK